MTENPQAAWLELFPVAANEPTTIMPFRVLQRGGVPFLYLPTRNRAAARALELYPAQSWKARLAKLFLQIGFRFSPLARGGGQLFSLPRHNIFLASLAMMAGQPVGRSRNSRCSPVIHMRRAGALSFCSSMQPANQWPW
jgi:hypothetical protein